MNYNSENIVDLFLEAAEAYPDRLAIIEKKNDITFGQLKEEVLSTAAYFQRKGIQAGDRVLVFIPMSKDLYRVVLALFYLGATAVFLDEWVSKKRLEVCCELADCKGFIGVWKARVLRLFSKSLRSIPVHLSMGLPADGYTPKYKADYDHSALITFTTGSTGIPKAADRSHGFLNEQFEALKEEMKAVPGQIDMTTLPIVLFVNLGMGCTSVIADGKVSKPDKINFRGLVQQIDKEGVQRLVSSPALLEKLSLHLLEEGEELKTVKQIFTGGAPVFPTEARLIDRAFPDSENSIVYGSTEAEPISSILVKDLIQADLDLGESGLLVGIPYHKTKLRIIGINPDPIAAMEHSAWEPFCLPEGQLGEIVVSGDHVLKRYFRNEEAFEKNKIIVDGEVWHRTGDSGMLREGKLFLMGRCAQLIERHGRYLSPFSVEGKLKAIDGLSIGTILDLKGELVLIIEEEEGQKVRKEDLDFIAYDKLLCLNRIPRDPRHQSKIDYNALGALV